MSRHKHGLAWVEDGPASAMDPQGYFAGATLANMVPVFVQGPALLVFPRTQRQQNIAACVERLGVTEAARELGITRASVSQALWQMRKAA